MIYQFTGLSGAGKTTIAEIVGKMLGIEVIDGDKFRKTHALGFNRMDRVENIRMMHRKALEMEGDVIIAAINPYEDVRNEIESQIVYFTCNAKTLEKRDTKGLYRLGILPDGLQYEVPTKCLRINTDMESIDESVRKVLQFISETR